MRIGTRRNGFLNDVIGIGVCGGIRRLFVEKSGLVCLFIHIWGTGRVRRPKNV